MSFSLIRLSRGAMICVVFLFVSTLRAGPLPIANYSFEADGLPPGAWIYSFSDWGEDVPGSIGAFVEFINGFSADGAHHLGINGIGSDILQGIVPPGTTRYEVFQELNFALEPNTTYELTAAIGNRNAVFNPQGGVAAFGLRASGILLQEGTFDAATIPVSTFIDQSITYTTDDNPIAGNLFIVLANIDTTGVGARSHFDNIRLSATPALVPEPATIALLAFGVLGIGFARRRRTD